MPPTSCHDGLAMKNPRAAGFTLVEAIVVIGITGIVAAGIAMFILRPVQSYVDAVRRAELTDVADTALRRIGRDIRSALPNSVRVVTAGGVTYLEYLQTSGGGRYRADVDSAGAGDILDFTANDTSFDVLGPVPPLSAGDRLVVYNLGPGTVESDAYTGNNSTTFASVAASTVTMAAKRFPFASPGRRFHVVQHPVTSACNPVSGELRRYWNYAIGAAQPTPPATANNALLARNVAACVFTYNTVTQRSGVVSLSLTLSQAGESVNLFQQVHVINVP
jgi:MSHA biogenesis protein MshO